MNNNINHLLKKAQTLFDNGKYTPCEKLLKKIKHIAPDNSHMLNIFGGLALSKKDFANAERFVLAAIKKDPNNSKYYYSLGLIYSETQHHDRAMSCYQKAVSISPEFVAAHTNLSIVFRTKGQYDKAVEHAKKAVELAPNNALVNNNLGVAYEFFGNFLRAQECYEKAATVSPDSIDILTNLASIYGAHDNKDKARECYLKILALKSNHGDAYRGLVGLKKYVNTDDPDALSIKKLASQSKLSDTNRTHLFFALGKIYDDCGDYDNAFKAIRKGNDIVDKHTNLNMATLSTYVDSHVSTFTNDFFNSRAAFGRSETMPIFVLGMPRSGTSLVEAILASHTHVFGAGELDWFDQLVSALPNLTGDKIQYPECITQLNAATVSNLGDKYITYLKMLSQNSPYVINKLPANFQRLGVIRLLFPNAKIIHCRRNPMDTCLSIYSRFFPNNLPWSYNLHKLGEYYIEYERLMKHWHSVIPDDFIFDIQYEDLVANQKVVTEHLLNFIGLPWEDGCMDYYKNKRGVRTASSQQVKQPVYSTSVGRWKHYEKHLGPLMKAMDMDMDMH